MTQTVFGNSLILSLSSGDSTCTVSVYSQKRILGPTSTCIRKPYAYSCRTVSQTCYQGCGCYAVCPKPCSSDPNQGGWGQCGCPPSAPYGGPVDVYCNQCAYDCSYQVCDVLINQTGNGYINNGSEWYKIT